MVGASRQWNLSVPRFLRKLIILAIVLLVFALLAAGVALSHARIELTAGGAHQRLLVPVGKGAIGFNMYTGTGDAVSLPGFLAGPVVRRADDGHWDAQWFCEDHVASGSGTADTLQVACGGHTRNFDLRQAPVAPAIAPMPEKLAVLSDLEGNIGFLDAALRRLGVVDAGGEWAYGGGQLVVLGDSVDRGRDVFAVLWRLHELAAQAGAAGGAVHVLLGNHEQYLLRGNTSRASADYRVALRRLGGPYDAFARDTVLGAWLRRQPVVLKLGDVLFTHAGISPQTAASGLTLAQLNATMRGYWNDDVGVAHTPALDAVLGRTGLTQYRGYFHEMEDLYPAATQEDVARVLARFGASRVVVAHTVVEEVGPRFDGLVYAVDVNHADARSSQVLVFERGVPRVVDLGVERGLAVEAPTRTRGISLWSAADRRLLADIYRGFKRIAGIPHPY